MTPQLETGAAGLTIRWDDGTVGQFPFIWLRDTDPSGFHPDTGERAFDLSTIPLDIRAEDAAIEGGALRQPQPPSSASRAGSVSPPDPLPPASLAVVSSPAGGTAPLVLEPSPPPPVPPG